jgi:sugar/nucleoside kinase (ribokinase family)
VDVVGLGLATLDTLALVPRLPERDEVYPAQRILLQGGGPVATALVTAARLGATASYLGPFAPTPWGALARAGLEAEGVSTRDAPSRETGEQAVSVILVDQATGQRSILYTLGQTPELIPAEVPPELVASARVLHLDGVHLEAACHAATLARRAGVPVSFDGGAGDLWSEVGALLPLVDILVVARRFAEQATGEADPLHAGPALLRRFSPRQVVITDGLRGCWYWDREQEIYQPAFAVDVVDTTGAGDVFHGAYLYALLQDWPAGRTLAFAAATAALKCRGLGGRSSIPTLRGVEAFLEGSDGSHVGRYEERERRSNLPFASGRSLRCARQDR